MNKLFHETGLREKHCVLVVKLYVVSQPQTLPSMLCTVRSEPRLWRPPFSISNCVWSRWVSWGSRDYQTAGGEAAVPSWLLSIYSPFCGGRPGAASLHSGAPGFPACSLRHTSGSPRHPPQRAGLRLPRTFRQPSRSISSLCFFSPDDGGGFMDS